MVECAVVIVYEGERYCMETDNDKRDFFDSKILPSLKNIPSELKSVFDGDNLYFVWRKNLGSTITIKNHIFSADNNQCELSYNKLISELNTKIEEINNELHEIYERFR